MGKIEKNFLQEKKSPNNLEIMGSQELKDSRKKEFGTKSPYVSYKSITSSFFF